MRLQLLAVRDGEVPLDPTGPELCVTDVRGEKLVADCDEVADLRADRDNTRLGGALNHVLDA